MPRRRGRNQYNRGMCVCVCGFGQRWTIKTGRHIVAAHALRGGCENTTQVPRHNNNNLVNIILSLLHPSLNPLLQIFYATFQRKKNFLRFFVVFTILITLFPDCVIGFSVVVFFVGPSIHFLCLLRGAQPLNTNPAAFNCNKYFNKI